MKNEEIHNGLKDKEIRDFLAKELNEVEYFGLISIDYVQKQIKELQKSLENARRYEAIKSLIEKNGWNDFDISEVIIYNEKKYFPFIGTEEEYDEFVKKAKK